jgi:membrane protease YdiL (CAAX protease family)
MRAQRVDRAAWRVFGVLVAAGLVGVLGLVPYLVTVLGPLLAGAGVAVPPLWVLVLLQVVQVLVLVAAATALGLWLGPRVGLGAPLVHDLLQREETAGRRLRALVAPSVGLGVAVGLVVVLLDLLVFTPGLPAPAGGAVPVQPPAWQGLLASLYGAVDEELLLRLGVMTLLVWVGARLTRASVPGPAVMWAAITVTAVLFGLGHLPATAVIWPLTPLVVLRALVLNGLGGLVFGWLYWRRGLLAAMVAHLAADLVLHVAAPLLG